MVGLSFQYYDQSLAFVNVHFAADKKGKSGTKKRLTVRPSELKWCR